MPCHPDRVRAHYTDDLPTVTVTYLKAGVPTAFTYERVDRIESDGVLLHVWFGNGALSVFQLNRVRAIEHVRCTCTP